MIITDLEHLENVTQKDQIVEGGFINLQAFAWARAEASKLTLTLAIAHTVAIAL